MSKSTKKPSASAGRKRITFQVTAPARSDVSVAGSFNGWQPQTLSPGSGKGATTYARNFFLQPGSHQYKFIINGEWLLDPTCHESVPNDYGSLNSVLTIP